METVDRWLKSLRLHKYTPIFRQLTYEQMLSIDEKFLIDLDITKGARNKILVSVKKLNLRHDRLANMEDDLNQDNISIKEALSLMKDMLITPIPKPLDESMPPSPTISLPESSLTSPESTTSSSGASSTTSGFDYADTFSIASTGSTPNSTPTIPVDSPNTTITSLNQDSSYTTMLAGRVGLGGETSTGNSFYTNPYELTYLFVETFEKLAQRLIDSGGFEDNACHGIMAGIVDECSKHNSFTGEQKARMARFKKPIMSRSGSAGSGRCGSSQQSTTREQKIKMVGFGHHQPHYPPNMRQSYHQQQQQYQLRQLPQRQQLIIQHQYYTPSPPAPRPPQNQYHFQASHNSFSTPHHVVQRKNVNIYNHHSSVPPYKEYSLLGPGITFELPCLRAKAEARKHNRRQFGFFTDNSSSSSSTSSSSSSSSSSVSSSD